MPIALLFVTALCTSVVLTQADAGDGQPMDLDCTTYCVTMFPTGCALVAAPATPVSSSSSSRIPSSPICHFKNSTKHMVTSAATKCSTSQVFGDQTGPLTTEKCTVSFGPTSATATICINEKRSFTCYGPVTGTANCKGCTQSSGSTDKPPNNPPVGGSSGNNSTSTSGNNSTNTPGSTFGDASGNTSVSTSGNTSGGTSDKPAGGAGTASPPSTGSTGSSQSGDNSAGAALGLNGVSLALATFMSFMFA
ncbi:hypothetical protein VP01_1851g3 [Puccinia sorghi]|uniref:Uncharacterized protein n=1 Tax=Puccinia sorghi TaxID=27349 RepID=A0A0L6VFI0_9BASI|nr:hypothetical protein VP01_1851g3 [Puccinia sorghi]